jgi:putative pyoverdin transport system ATP-binding/permease protein
MLRLLEFLRREEDFPHIRILIMIGISGIAGGAILAVINQAAARIAVQQPITQLLFIILILLIKAVFTQHYSLIQVTQAVEEILLKQRLRIANKLRHLELRKLEELGIETVQAPLAKDTSLISQAALSMTLLVRSAIVVTVSLLYLGWLSLPSLLVTIAFISTYVFIYVVLIQPKITTELQESLSREAGLFRHINALLGGFKELKLARRKNAALFEQFSRTASAVNEIKRGINTHIANSFTIGYSTFYLLLIVLVIVIPTFSMQASGDVFKITATVFFILSELDPWLTWVPAIARSDAAIEMLCRLEFQLDLALQDKTDGNSLQALHTFQSIVMDNLVFQYGDPRERKTFAIGPLNIRLQQGELLFIVGGNGDGKTTLLKLLCGLYLPSSGSIKLDDQTLEQSQYPAYRELFAAVFADFYLFDRLYGLPEFESSKVNHWLEVLKLRSKTRYLDGQFTEIELSSGQRRRLAFLTAVLEDKPIYIFDELAADQDPSFREYYYTVALPTLKKQGKTIIAVTHDEKYFNMADRILALQEGKLV